MTSIATQDKLSWSLRDADRTMRLFITAFLLLLTAGYVIGLVFVDHTTSGTPQGIAQNFRGTPENGQATEIKYPKSPAEIYTFLHNHILSLALVFFAVGGIFYFTSMPHGPVKEFLLIEPFFAILTTFGGIWLMSYLSEYFSWVVLISGVSMIGCYLAMVILILKDLWIRK